MPTPTPTLLHEIVENWTGLLPVQFQLNQVGFNITNYEIEMLWSKNGVDVAFGGTLIKRTQTGDDVGWADIAPAPGDFQHSHQDWEMEFYDVRFLVRDSNGRLESFPNRVRDQIGVRRA